MHFQQRVLFVDDHEDTRALVAPMLDACEVKTASNYGDGLRLAAGEKFNLILLDYYLPDGNGLDLCSQIRAFDITTPILIVTATHSIEHKTAIKTGAQGVLKKDHLAYLLPAAIARALEVGFEIAAARKSGLKP